MRILFVILLISVSAIRAQNLDFKYFLNSEGTLTLEEYTGYDCRVIIPSEISGKKVGSILPTLFLSLKQPQNFVSSVEIRNGIKTIDLSAFEPCYKITNITIPTSLQKIIFKNRQLMRFRPAFNVTSNNAFYASKDGFLYTKDMTVLISSPKTGKGEIGIPEKVNHIGSYCFSYTKDLQEIKINSNIKTIGDGAFLGCFNLSKVSISSQITEIPDYLFSDCTSLTDLPIPSNVTNIGVAAFQNCSFSSVIIPDQVKLVGGGAFLDNKKLTNLVIGNSVSTIGSEAFAGCERLSRIEIGTNVTSIGNRAFRGCKSLTSVEIPGSVNSLGMNILEDCPKLTNITVHGVFQTNPTSDFTGK